jgi:hypothetical protein
MKKTFIKFFLITLIFISSTLLTCVAQVKQVNSTSSIEIKKIKEDISSIKNQQELEKKQFDYLTQDTKDFKQFIQQERKEHQDFLENLYQKTCWAVGILITLFIGICSFFGWKSFKNIEQQVECEIKNKANTIIEAANIDVESKLTVLNKKIESELSYKKANIFVLSTTDNTGLNRATSILESKGINHIKFTSDINELSNKFCLIICSLDECNNDQNKIKDLTEKTVNYIIENQLDIPIIFYIANGSISNLKQLSEFPVYFTPANNPTTLIMHCFTLLKMFC